MKWNRSVFSKHYKIVRVKGSNGERLLNLCLARGLAVSRVKYISNEELLLKVYGKDYSRFEDIARGRYYIEIVNEDGITYRAGLIVRNKALMAGLLLFTGIIFYQSLFIAEIQVNGYEAINEQTLRKTMRDAGLYEGCRKNININKVKLHMYEQHDNISWIGIQYNGSLAVVTIVETDSLYETNRVVETSPCNIVADKSGYINSVDPEQGIRAVEDGSYVDEGDVLISGIVPLSKTTYEEDSEKDTETYVHAKGTVDARIPVRVNFYEMSSKIVKHETGRHMITLSVNGAEIGGHICPFEYSTVKKVTVCNWIRPLRLKIQLNIIDEVTLESQIITDIEVKKEVLNEIHKYIKEKLPDNTQILNKSLNFTREKNIIYIGVTLETLQKIGIEEEIIVDKSNRQSEKNDDQ